MSVTRNNFHGPPKQRSLYEDDSFTEIPKLLVGVPGATTDKGLRF